MNKGKSELPKLPRGMGSYDYTSNGSIRYRKSVTVNGDTEKLSVVGNSISEVNRLMKEAESVVKNKLTVKKMDEKHQTLQEGMHKWLTLYKMQEVIERTYDRIESTYLTHIVGSILGTTQETKITSDMIQDFMNNLKSHKTNGNEIDNGLSYSSKKKVYELLSQYFKYKYIREPYLNPMLTVTKPIKNVEAIHDEELVVWDDDEIISICKEAIKPLKNGINGYKHGCALIFIMWIFCRIGEAQALQWKDINLETGMITISKSYSRVKVRDGANAGKYKYKIVKTKNKQIRTFKMCQMAIDAITEYKKRINPKSEDEYVLSTETGSILTTTSITRMYNNLINNTDDINHDKHVTLHGLRHTGISYFLRHGVPVEVVSRMAGHQSIQITIDTYYSIIEEQKAQAIDIINDVARIDFMN